MGSIEFINSKGEEDRFHINDKLAKNVLTVKERVNKRDFDQVFLIDGAEGSGKSVFGMQLAKACDPSFTLDRVCLNASQYVNAIQTADKGQAIVYDEAYTGLASRQSLSEVNKVIVSMMMEMRSKNLIVIVILPTFFMLDRYVAIFRSKGLFHVYTSKGRRGYWIFYNQKKKKLLYIFGKKLLSYQSPKVRFKGNFYGKYVVNEEDYRKKKDFALKNRDGKDSASGPTQKEDRNRYIMEHAIYILHTEFKQTIKGIELLLKDGEHTINKSAIGEICKKMYGKKGKSVHPGK